MTDVSSPRSTAEEAQRRVDRIRGHVSSAWEEVITAYKRRDHEALGYGTGQAGWDAYILGEFGESRLSLPRHQRVEHVLEASAAGLSNRAIASAASVTEGTVRNDLRGQVRKSYAPAPPAEPTFDDTPDWDPAGATYDVATRAVTPGTVTGMDGKTYTRPAPEPVTVDHDTGEIAQAKPKRKPITDTARDIGLDLNALTNRIDRLMDDDRFDRNRDDIAARLRHHIATATATLNTLDSKIN